MKKKTDYQTLFYMGIIAVSAGLALMTFVNIGVGISFLALGGLYMLFGEKNQDKYKKAIKKSETSLALLLI